MGGYETESLMQGLEGEVGFVRLEGVEWEAWKGWKVEGKASTECR